ncbi:MAG: hypothetical protein H6673_06945 [Anaerolineales bacterium]|nr:hypothetical protein [Anaerolineales bacterium]
MRTSIILLVLLILAIPAPIHAQDPTSDCDPSAIAALYAARLTEADSIEEIREINLELSTVLGRCDFGIDGVTTESEGSRTDPVPFGEFFKFDSGRVRIVGLLNPAEVNTRSNALQEGEHVAAIYIEYLCELTDPNETCSNYDASFNGYVTPDGVIYEYDMKLYDSSLPDTYPSTEVYGGNKIEGYVYFRVPDTVSEFTVRLSVGYNRIFFQPAIVMPSEDDPVAQLTFALNGMGIECNTVLLRTEFANLECIVAEGEVTEETANTVYETTIGITGDLTFFSTILDDGTHASDFVYDDDGWRETVLR